MSTRAPRTDTEHLAAAAEHFAQALKHLRALNLRTYRGRLEQREAIQEARNSAECGVDWTKEAMVLGAKDPHVIDVRHLSKVG